MGSPERLPAVLAAMLQDHANTPVFSVASLRELVIKQALGRPDFPVEQALLRRALLDGGWQELPPLHSDPFDRLLLAWRPIRGRCG